MEAVGIIKETGELIKFWYNESEHYTYMVGSRMKAFKTNSYVKAFIKIMLDLNIKCDEIEDKITLTEKGKWYLEMFKEVKLAYENERMEHAIGLSQSYRIKNRPILNSRNKPLKRYFYWRNYYNTPECGDEKIEALVKEGLMEKTSDNFYKVTWQGLYWLETKYDLKIYRRK